MLTVRSPSPFSHSRISIHGSVRSGSSTRIVIHSLRHTKLTRLGEAGADAITITKIAGHSSVTVSQRYVHPSPEAVERAFERLESLGENQEQPPERQLATTDSTTHDRAVPSWTN